MLMKLRGFQPLSCALLAATFLTPPGLAHAAPGDALGDEFQVNTRSSDWQYRPDVATDDSGNFVVVWAGYGEGSTSMDIVAQRYNSAGVPQGSEFIVNSTLSGSQAVPAVAMDADGDFVVAWEDSVDIFARRFDAAGIPKGNEFQVSTDATRTSAELSAVAMDADGDFVVAWRSEGPGPSPYTVDFSIFAKRFNAAGEPQGAEFQVGTLGGIRFGVHDIAMDDQGNFVVGWTSWWGDGDQYGVLAQRYDRAGIRQGSEFVVSTTTTDEQLDPSVAMDSDGDFVIAWAGYGYGRGDGIFFRRFDAAGSPVSGEIQVVGSGEIRNVAADVAMNADGNLLCHGRKGFRFLVRSTFTAGGTTPRVRI